MPDLRKAGVVLPLFSIRTGRDWGVGQITDLPACASWVLRAGQRLLQILPPHELSAGETSPYGALTAFGLDPIYIGLEAVPDLEGVNVADALGDEGVRALEAARRRRTVDFATVRALKMRMLGLAFQRFYEREWVSESDRARRLLDFIRAEHAWLDDFTLYTILRASRGGFGWQTWPDDQRHRSPSALDRVRQDEARRMVEVSYMQWLALEQWEAARGRMRELGVELMGDLPFVVGDESADVWSHASQFRLDMSLGAPPDAYAAEGQDWGLPPYDWDAMAKDDFAWLRARTRHSLRLYDRFRLDHVVGYFRQWMRPRPHHQGDGSGGDVSGSGPRNTTGEAPRNNTGHDPRRGRFDPAAEEAQKDRGLQVLGVILEEVRSVGSPVAFAIAEDLGAIPPYVRENLTALGMPGYRVLPWERAWNTKEQEFLDPTRFPTRSVATWSTHDTAPITAWWDEFTSEDRAALARRVSVAVDAPEAERTLALLTYLFRSSSELTLVLAQELLGERDRINTPATVGPHNWVYRLPRPIEELESDPDAVARLEAVRQAALASGR